MKKIYRLLGFVILILTLLALSIHFSNLDSKIKDIVVAKIHQTAQQHNISIQWKSITVGKFSLKVIFNQVQFQNPILSSEFSSLSLQIAPLKSLLRRQLVFNIQAYNGDIDISHKPSNKKHPSYDFIFSLPIHKVFLKNSKMQFQTSQGPVYLKNIDLRIYNILNSFFINIKTQIHISHLISDIESKISLYPNKMTIHSFVLKGQDSQMFLTGRVSSSIFNIQTAQFELKTELDSKDLFTGLQFWKTPFKLPHFSGKAKIQSQLSYSKKEGTEVSFQTEMQDFLWKHIAIDKIKTEGRFIQNRIELKMAHLEKKMNGPLF